MASKDTLDLVLELARRERAHWDAVRSSIPAWHPRNDGDEGAGDDAGDDGQGGDDAGDDDDAGAASGETDWKQHARKHERRAKQIAKELEQLKKAEAERADAQKSEQEKAIEKAREEARNEVLTAAQKERRADRLDAAVTRLAARGITVGEESVKFADPDDVLAFIERALDKGDIDPDDIFDSESKVQTDALTAALADLAKRKPHWLAGKPGPGENDAGKGTGGRKSIEDLSVEDHLAQIKRHK